jgi:hypothetical protein
MPPRLAINYVSHIDLARDDLVAEIRSRVADCLRDFPEICEGSIHLAGVEYFFTYKRAASDLIEVNLLPRDVAEEILNENGLTTDEPFNPLRRHPRADE